MFSGCFFGDVVFPGNSHTNASIKDSLPSQSRPSQKESIVSQLPQEKKTKKDKFHGNLRGPTFPSATFPPGNKALIRPS